MNLLKLNMPKVYDGLILGSGFAGLSTALTLGRLHRTCAILSNSTFRNAGAHAAHAILGHDGKSPEEIRRTGRREIEAYRHADFIDATIMKVYKENSSHPNHEVFVAEDQQGNRWSGRTLVIATGSKDVFPHLPGFVENWPDNM